MFALATTFTAPATAAVHIHDSVHRTLQQEGRVSIVLTLKEQRPDDLLIPTESTSASEKANRSADVTGSEATPSPSPTMKKSSKKACMDHEGEQRDGDAVADDADTVAAVDGGQVQAMVDRLVQYTEEKHQEVMTVIKQDAEDTTTPESGKAKSLWITNEIYIRDATPELIEKLKEVPSLGSIREEVIAHVSVKESAAVTMDETDFVGEWGLERIQALDAWKLGYLGRNIRVGSIDTGVRVTHEALRENYVGQYGWYDPISKTETPTDPANHGTGVMGILAGGQGFGVAPKAEWMSCRACDEDLRCREANLLECAQFMTCPFVNGDKTKTDCSKKPHVLNNSWNSERGVTVFENAINVWISAGIIPVFSNGNNGPGCGTVNSPADSTVGITVGATDYDDLLAGFSGRGPGLSGEIKPDLTAPGDTVVAPGSTSDSDINVFSGTSFAAPHVAGAIALMLEAFPGLTLSEVKSLLYQNTDTSVLSLTSQPTCGALNSASAFPNNAFGYGRVNVLKAINAKKAAVAAASSARSGPASSGATTGSVTTPVVATGSSFNSSSSGSSSSSSSGPRTVNVGDF
ncbi:Subtilisin serine protease, partial [Globisporangium splendens]